MLGIKDLIIISLRVNCLVYNTAVDGVEVSLANAIYTGEVIHGSEVAFSNVTNALLIMDSILV